MMSSKGNLVKLTILRDFKTCTRDRLANRHRNHVPSEGHQAQNYALYVEWRKKKRLNLSILCECALTATFLLQFTVIQGVLDIVFVAKHKRNEETHKNMF